MGRLHATIVVENRGRDVLKTMPAIDVQHLALLGPAGRVHDLSLCVHPGQVVAVVDEAQAASWLMQALTQTLPPETQLSVMSEAWVLGEEWLSLPQGRLAQRLGRVLMSLPADARSAFYPNQSLGSALRALAPGSERRARLDALAHRLSLSSADLKQPAGQASWRLCQQALLLAGLMAQSSIVVAQAPPLEAPDGLHHLWLQSIRSLHALEPKTTWLLLTQRLVGFEGWVDAVTVVKAGRVVEQGAPDALSHAYSRFLQQADASPPPKPNPSQRAPRLFSFQETVWSCPKRWGWTRRSPLFEPFSLSVPRGQTLAMVGLSADHEVALCQGLLGERPPQSGQLIAWDAQGQPGSWSACAAQCLGPPETRQAPRCIGDLLEDSFGLELDPQARAWSIQRGLARVQLPEDCLSLFPHELSLLDRQRLTLLQILWVQPECVVLRHPTQGLLPGDRAVLSALLVGLQKEFGWSYVLWTHATNLLVTLADELAVMMPVAGKPGVVQLLESGSVKTILTQPKHAQTRDVLQEVGLLA